LTKEEGGRHTPFFTDTGRSFTSAPRTCGRREAAEGVEMVMPGDK